MCSTGKLPRHNEPVLLAFSYMYMDIYINLLLHLHTSYMTHVHCAIIHSVGMYALRQAPNIEGASVAVTKTGVC